MIHETQFTELTSRSAVAFVSQDDLAHRSRACRHRRDGKKGFPEKRRLYVSIGGSAHTTGSGRVVEPCRQCAPDGLVLATVMKLPDAEAPKDRSQTSRYHMVDVDKAGSDYKAAQVAKRPLRNRRRRQ